MAAWKISFSLLIALPCFLVFADVTRGADETSGTRPPKRTRRRPRGAGQRRPGLDAGFVGAGLDDDRAGLRFSIAVWSARKTC